MPDPTEATPRPEGEGHGPVVDQEPAPRNTGPVRLAEAFLAAVLVTAMFACMGLVLWNRRLSVELVTSELRSVGMGMTRDEVASILGEPRGPVTFGELDSAWEWTDERGTRGPVTELVGWRGRLLAYDRMQIVGFDASGRVVLVVMAGT